ncbi:MAG: stage II sporulation protein E [Clostridia bacterium]|nr:stage II sporulation protein E [Clostridia bacterium]
MSENPHVYPFKRKEEEIAPPKGLTDILLNHTETTKPKAVPKVTVKTPGRPTLKGAAQNAAGAAALPSNDKADKSKSMSFVQGITYKDVLLLLLGFTLGRAEILAGLYPFGIAMVVAVSLYFLRLAGFVLLSVMLGYFTVLGMTGFSYLLICFILASVFYFYRLDSKKQWFIVPAATIAIVASVKAVGLIFTGVTTYSLMISFFESLFAAGLSLIMMIACLAVKKLKREERLSVDELVCCFVVLLGGISGIGDFSVGGIEIADMASRFLVMLAALWGGAGAGAGVGALMGIVPSLSLAAAPSTVGIYAFSGLLAGAFNAFGRLGVVAGFLLGNIMLSLYLVNPSAIRGQLVASLIAGILLFAIPSKLMKRGNNIFSNVGLKSAAEDKGQRLLRLSARRLKNTAWIFRELGDDCKLMANKDKPDERENINMVLSHLCNKVCEQCSIRQVCWTISLEETYRGVMELFQVAEKNGIAKVKDAPANFQKRCPHLKELVVTVNCLYELYCRSNYWQSQRMGTRLFLAAQLEGTAQVLENIAREMSSMDGERGLIEGHLANALASRGLTVEAVQVSHISNKTLDLLVGLKDCPGENYCRDLIENECSKILGRSFRVQEASCNNACGERCRFSLLEAGARKISIGKAQLAKDGLGICGDCGSSLLLEEGKQLLMISDGMGVGLQAAMQSGTAVNMLSRLLEAGFGKDNAIDTVNHVLMLSGKEESFVTLDMCIIDLYGGEAEFIKTGGAPSFIKRGHKVETVRAQSLPVGMLAKVEKEQYLKQLQNGDMIILASDGLLDADSKIDIKWLTNVLADTDIKDAQMLAEYLLSKTVSISGGRMRDDITILVAAVGAA